MRHVGTVWYLPIIGAALAILTGYAVWRPIRARGSGKIAVDIEQRSMLLITD